MNTLRGSKRLLLLTTMLTVALVGAAVAQESKSTEAEEPNIVIIWGDDIGQTQHQRLFDGADGLSHA